MPISQWEGERKQLSYPPDPPTQNHCLSQTLRKTGEFYVVWVAGPSPTLTSAVLLVRPVPAVVLPVTFPPVGDAVPVPLDSDAQGSGPDGGEDPRTPTGQAPWGGPWSP